MLPAKKFHRVELCPSARLRAGWMLFKVIQGVPGHCHLCEQTGLILMYRFVVLHCVPHMNGWMPSLSSMLVVYCLSSGFVGVCSYARLSGSQHGLSSFVSCLLQSEKRGVSALSGQRGAKRNPADSNKHQQHIVKFTGLRKQASCKAVYQVGRDNTKAGQTRTISLVMFVFCINKMWLFIWEVVFSFV